MVKGAIAFVLLLSANAVAGPPTPVPAAPRVAPGTYAPETVVARVDGRPITFGEVLYRLAQLPDDARRGYDGRPDGLRLFLRDVVAKEVVLSEARATGVDRDPEFGRLLEVRRAEVMLDVYARRTLLTAIDEKALRARYEAARARFDVKPSVHLLYLLVTPAKEKVVPNESGDDAIGEGEAKAKAERLRAEILINRNFSAVARRASEDASAASGGDLGLVDPSRLVDEVARAAMSVPIGEVSPVIRSALGYHVIQPLARRPGGVIPFEAVRELLLQEAAGEMRSELAAKARADRERLEKKHAVEIFPERLP